LTWQTDVPSQIYSTITCIGGNGSGGTVQARRKKRGRFLLVEYLGTLVFRFGESRILLDTVIVNARVRCISMFLKPYPDTFFLFGVRGGGRYPFSVKITPVAY